MLHSIPPIPMNDLQRLYEAHRESIETAAVETLRSGWWLNGPRGQAFAENFARYLGSAECILVANGTDALELALRALRADRQAEALEVVTVANAGGYSTTACLQIGLIPVYVDIEEASQLISIGDAIAALTDRTMAVIATHLYGNAVDVPALRSAMQRAGFGHVAVIEDCAQAHGARVSGRMAGSMGDVATFSFYPTKNLGAMGDGGAVVAGNREIAAGVRRLQQYGWRAKYDIGRPGGRNSRMDEIQSAVLDVILPHLDEHNLERSRILDRFRAHGGERVKFIDRREGSVVHLAVALCDDRDGFRSFLTGRGIASEIHYPILDPDQHGWRDQALRTAHKGLSVSRASVGRILSLPCFPGMTESEIDRVCSALTDWQSR